MEYRRRGKVKQLKVARNNTTDRADERQKHTRRPLPVLAARARGATPQVMAVFF